MKICHIHLSIFAQNIDPVDCMFNNNVKSEETSGYPT